MKTMKKSVFSLLLVGVLAACGSVTAFAAEADNAAYGYQTGQAQNESRHAAYGVMPDFATDAEREAWFEGNGIGGDGPYSDAGHLDAEALVAAGVIDQADADAIAAYGSTKHDSIRAGYANFSNMTANERQVFYDPKEADASDGDSVFELVAAGVITQKQADAINAYLAG